MFNILDTSRMLRLTDGRDDNQVKMILTTFILLNSRTWLCGFGSDFNVVPLTLEDYLPLYTEFPQLFCTWIKLKKY